MKAIFLIGILMGIASINATAMNNDDIEIEVDHYEDNPGFIPPIVAIWTLPEEADQSMDGYHYDRAQSIHEVILRGNIHHLIDRLKALQENEINSRAPNGNTCLHLAAMRLSWRRVDLLLRAGAEPNVLNAHDQNPVDLMPEVTIYIDRPLLSVMQAQMVIPLMLQAKINDQEYDLILCEDGRLEL